MKYEVKRTDGRDNKDEVYFVLRVDDAFKNSEISIEAVAFYLNKLEESSQCRIFSIDDFLCTLGSKKSLIS